MCGDAKTIVADCRTYLKIIRWNHDRCDHRLPVSVINWHECPDRINWDKSSIHAILSRLLVTSDACPWISWAVELINNRLPLALVHVYGRLLLKTIIIETSWGTSLPWSLYPDDTPVSCITATRWIKYNWISQQKLARAEDEVIPKLERYLVKT